MAIARKAGLAAGTVYPMMEMYIAAGWVADHLETDLEHAGAPRPKRHYFTLTRRGRLGLELYLAENP